MSRDDHEQPDPERDDASERAPDEGDAPERAKKERVLHTRVPAVLEQELKRLATNLKMPVSNLVRAILEDALDAVDAVGQRAEGELQGIAERLRVQRDALRGAAVGPGAAARQPGARPGDVGEEDDAAAEGATPECPASSDALEGVIGFQPLVLAASAACTVCGRALPKGSQACRGVRDEAGGPRLLVARDCALVPAGGDEG